MSHILSKVESIDRLIFEPFPSPSKRPVSGKALYVGRCVLMFGSDGRVYTNAVRKSVAYIDGGGRFEDVFRACVKLGVLSQQVVDEHNALVAEYQRKRARQYAAEYLDEHLKTLGIKLTATQRRLVSAAKPKDAP